MPYSHITIPEISAGYGGTLTLEVLASIPTDRVNVFATKVAVFEIWLAREYARAPVLCIMRALDIKASNIMVTLQCQSTHKPMQLPPSQTI